MKNLTDLQNDVQQLNTVTNAIATAVAGVSNVLNSVRQQLQTFQSGATPEQIDALTGNIDNSLTALNSAAGALTSLAADPNNPVPPLPPLPTPAPGVADTGQADSIVAGGTAPAAPVDSGASAAPGSPAAGGAAPDAGTTAAGATAPPAAPQTPAAPAPGTPAAPPTPPAMDVV